MVVIKEPTQTTEPIEFIKTTVPRKCCLNCNRRSSHPAIHNKNIRFTCAYIGNIITLGKLAYTSSDGDTPGEIYESQENIDYWDNLLYPRSSFPFEERNIGLVAHLSLCTNFQSKLYVNVSDIFVRPSPCT